MYINIYLSTISIYAAGIYIKYIIQMNWSKSYFFIDHSGLIIYNIVDLKYLNPNIL